jgi:hypothetical protein
MSRIFARNVDRDELLYLRETEHLSNAEIAQRYGVSYSTINNILGPAPKECRQKPGRAPANVPDAPAANEGPEEACLLVQRPVVEIISLAQSERTYKIESGKLYIEEHGSLGILLKELPDLIKELTATQRKADALPHGGDELI